MSKYFQPYQVQDDIQTIAFENKFNKNRYSNLNTVHVIVLSDNYFQTTVVCLVHSDY
jgi:hypothetical protein